MSRTLLTWFALLVVVALTAVVWTAHAAEPAATSATPDAVTAAVRKAFPKAQIGRSAKSVVTRVVYGVRVVEDGKSADLLVAEDGTIVRIERELSASALPEAVAAGFQKASGGLPVEDIERAETRARLGFTALAASEIRYEAEFERDGVEYEVLLDGDGNVIRIERDDEDDDADDDDDEEDDD